MKCSYCKEEMNNEVIKCPNCDGIQYEVTKEDYNWGEEKIYFDLDAIKITNRIFIANNQIFSLEKIKSIRVDNKEKGIGNIGWGVAGLALVLIATFPGYWKLLGVVLLYVGLKTPKVYHSLKVITSNGEQEALLLDDSDQIREIVEALKKASHHGENEEENKQAV